MTDTAEQTGSYAENKTSQDELEGRDDFRGVRQKNTSTQLIQSGQTEALNKIDTAEKTDPHYTMSGNSSKAKAAIHLLVNTKDKLAWENDTGHAFAQGGFQLVNRQIVIPQTGLYFVYSQASFRVSCTRRKDPTHLSHKIWRYIEYYDHRLLLMSAVRSACQNTSQEESYRDGQGWYDGIYLGAAFQLNKGDQLWTETNQLSELETDESRTFFGVFAL